MINIHAICSDCARKKFPPKPRDDRFQCKNCGKRSEGSWHKRKHEEVCDVHVMALTLDSSHIMSCAFCRTNRIGLVVDKRKAAREAALRNDINSDTQKANIKRQAADNRSNRPIIQPPGTA